MELRGDRRRFGVDRWGHWVNIQPECKIVGPDLHTANYSQIQSAIGHAWFNKYSPKAGDVIIDVGAGIGEDAVVFSHLVGASGRIHAIEAHPRTFQCLHATVEQSGLSNVETHQLAIMQHDGRVVISDDAHHLANSILSEGDGLEVEALSLDRFIEGSGHDCIDFLKMNIEGAELGAMLGLEKHASKVRHMAISCHDFVADTGFGDQFRTKEAVRARLLELGFTVSERSDAKTPWEADVLFVSQAQ